MHVARVSRLAAHALTGVDARSRVAYGLKTRHGRARSIVREHARLRGGSGRSQSSFDVTVVVGTAANVAGEAGAHFIRGRMRIAREQPLGAHQLTGGAVAALRGIVLHESVLEQVELLPLAQAFHGLN